MSEAIFETISMVLQMDKEQVKKAGALALIFLMNQIKDKEMLKKSIEALNSIMDMFGTTFPFAQAYFTNLPIQTVSEGKIPTKKSKKES
jgi:hypothetical protein